MLFEKTLKVSIELSDEELKNFVEEIKENCYEEGEEPDDEDIKYYLSDEIFLSYDIPFENYKVEQSINFIKQGVKK